MIAGIDHLVIAVRDLAEAGATVVRELGLDISAGGRHVQLGTANVLVWLGDSYLELLEVTDPPLAARSWIGVPALASLEAGGGLATYALESDALATDLRLLRERGSTMDGPLPGERLRPDGQSERWQLGLPAELGPDRPPFLIEHDLESPDWRADARLERAAHRHAARGRARLARLDLAVEAPASLAAAFSRELGISTVTADVPGGQRRQAALGPHAVGIARSAIGRPAATISIACDGGSGREVEVLGCRFVLQRRD